MTAIHPLSSDDLTFARLAAGEQMSGALARDESGRAVGFDQVYWLTQESNSGARALYDRVAERTGFLHYQISLD